MPNTQPVLMINGQPVGQVGGEGGTGGHIIVNQAGTSLTPEPNMQFADIHLEDDPTNHATKIQLVKKVTKQQLDNLGSNTDGLYKTDEPDATISPSKDDCVEVTADGNTTRRDLFNWLFNHCDTSKIRENAYIVYSGNGRIYHYEDINNGTYIFAWESIRATTIEKVCLQLNSSTSTEIDWTLATTGNTKEENYSYKPTNGYKYTLFYGNKKAVTDLQIKANRCLMNDGETTVEQALTITKKLVTPLVGVPSSSVANRNFYVTDKRTFIEYHFILDSSTTAIGNDTKIFNFPDDIDTSNITYQYFVATQIKNNVCNLVYVSNSGIYLSNATSTGTGNYLVGTIRISLL